MNSSESTFSERLLFSFFRTDSARLGGLMAIPSAASTRVCFITCGLHLLKRTKLACKDEYSWLSRYRDTIPCHYLALLLQGLLFLSLQLCTRWHPSLNTQACWCFSLITAIAWPGIIGRNPKYSLNYTWIVFGRKPRTFAGKVSKEELISPPAIKFANAFPISLLCALTFAEEQH